MHAAPRDASVSPSDGPRTPGRPAPSRRVAPGIVPALLRTRPVVVGAFFSAHAKLQPAGGTGIERSAAPGVLVVAVPRRVLRRAVDRNAMRRVAREAWRAAALDRSPVVAMLRLKRAPEVDGLRVRKRVAREELDRVFVALRRKLLIDRATSTSPSPIGRRPRGSR